MALSSFPFEYVTRSEQLNATVWALTNQQAIALDTESDSFYRYPEQLCLVRIATNKIAFVVDTLALPQLAPLGKVLADKSIEKVIHSADYDIRTLDRHHGLRIHGLYDTSIVARFAGIGQIGLAALIKEALGITIPKNERLQRGDWGHRPLSAEALDYAVTDVQYLLTLRVVLNQRLEGLGRTTWVAEECAVLEQIRYVARDPCQPSSLSREAITWTGVGSPY